MLDELDKPILYWIEQFDYKPINTGKLIDYIKDNWVKEERDVVEEFVEVMEIKIPSLDLLDWERITEEDEDYELLKNGRFLNIYQLESNETELKRLNLIE